MRKKETGVKAFFKDALYNTDADGARSVDWNFIAMFVIIAGMAMTGLYALL
jgi:hypothetical protein